MAGRTWPTGRFFLTLGPIAEGQWRSETELWREFELARSAILGALLDAVAHGLRALGSVQLARLPRMADFALWAAACETSLWHVGTFARAYTANRRAAIEGMMRASEPPWRARHSCRARPRAPATQNSGCPVIFGTGSSRETHAAAAAQHVGHQCPK